MSAIYLCLCLTYKSMTCLLPELHFFQKKAKVFCLHIFQFKHLFGRGGHDKNHDMIHMQFLRWTILCNNTQKIIPPIPPIIPPIIPKKSRFWQNKAKHLKKTFHTCIPKFLMIWSTVLEIWSVMDWNWHFLVIFGPFTCLETQKNKILKNWINLLEI